MASCSGPREYAHQGRARVPPCSEESLHAAAEPLPIETSPLPSGLLSPALAVAWPAAAAGDGKVTCEIMENGKPASGVVRLPQGEAEIASGACGKAVDVAPGTYTAALGLDGALDSPGQRKQVTVAAGPEPEGRRRLRHRPARGPHQGRRPRRRRHGDHPQGRKQIGTLGSGVSAHLSAGSYEVVARYRAQERTLRERADEKDKRTALDASFE